MLVTRFSSAEQIPMDLPKPEHSLAKVPVLLVVGKREAKEGTVTIRRLGAERQETLALDQALATLESEAAAPAPLGGGSSGR